MKSLSLIATLALSIVAAGCGAEPTADLHPIVNGSSFSGPDPLLQSTVFLEVDYKVRKEKELRWWPLGVSSGATQKASGRCSGTVLSNHLILTAAHCIPSSQIVDSRNTVDSSVKIRIHFFNGQKRAATRIASSFVLHPQWIGSVHEDVMAPESLTSPDLALIRFDGGLPEGFKPAMLLDDPALLTTSQEVRLAGFGKRNPYRRDTVGLPQHATLRINRLLHLEQSLGGTPALVELSPGTNGESICAGDSGGPAFIERDGELLLWGVAHKSWLYCDGESYFFNVLAFAQFIQAEMAK